MLLRLDWCDPGEKTKAILLMLEKSSSNFVGVRKKSHILVIFPFLAPGVFDPYMAPLVHTWSAFFCSHHTNWEAEFQREDSGGLWSFERLVPESFCFWFDHSSRHDYRMFLWRGRLFPTSPVRYRSFVLSIWWHHFKKSQCFYLLPFSEWMWNLICALWVGRDRASWWDLVYNILILKSPKTRESSIFHKEVSAGNKDKRYFQPHKPEPLWVGSGRKYCKTRQNQIS